MAEMTPLCAGEGHANNEIVEHPRALIERPLGATPARRETTLVDPSAAEMPRGAVILLGLARERAAEREEARKKRLSERHASPEKLDGAGEKTGRAKKKESVLI